MYCIFACVLLSFFHFLSFDKSEMKWTGTYSKNNGFMISVEQRQHCHLCDSIRLSTLNEPNNIFIIKWIWIFMQWKIFDFFFHFEDDSTLCAFSYHFCVFEKKNKCSQIPDVSQKLQSVKSTGKWKKNHKNCTFGSFLNTKKFKKKTKTITIFSACTMHNVQCIH